MAVFVQRADFDVSAEIAKLTGGATNIGAVATFIGKVRGETDGVALQSMSLEHYPGMTEGELARIEATATQRFNLSASCIIHRVGTLLPGDNIVLVITCAPHRRDALAACDFLMDYLKTDAPFWKKEVTARGDGAWVDARTTDASARERWSKF
ncbi:MAG TPA: molybdenum cofactor biosynthesis protein MoaE [Hyphomicrobium sp.]|nr:molybdenum cofactor biosynthesis protein MoaE [Hyphomicrobium sp.]